MTRLAFLLELCSLLLAPIQAAGLNCAMYGLEPPLNLVNPPAMLNDGFALTTYIGSLGNQTTAVLGFAESGQLLWARRLIGEANSLDSAAGTGDGNLLVAGESQTSIGSAATIAKLTPDGTVRWSRFIRGTKVHVWGFDGALDGGGYAALWGGVAELPEAQMGLVLRFRREGEISWARAIAVGDHPVIQPVVASQPYGVLIGKTWQVAFDKPSAILLIKLSANGDLNWSRLISATGRDLGVSNLSVLGDASVVVAGSAHGDGEDGSDTALIRLDKNGNPAFSIALHAPPLGNLHLISQGRNDSLLLAGTTARGGPTLADPVAPNQPTIVEVSVKGQIAWAKVEDFGAQGGNLRGFAQGKDHMVAVGSRGNWGPAMLLRLTPDGNPVTGGWNAATLTPLASKHMDLMVARTVADVRPIHLDVFDAGLSTTEANVKLVPLCPKQ